MMNCKYYNDFNKIINKNKWNNKFSIINCIDNETYYDINLKYNNEEINIITDFKIYCNFLCNENNTFTDLNLEMIYYNKYEIIDILKLLDNFKILNNKEKLVEYNDEYNFFQKFKSFSKYLIDYNILKSKSKLKTYICDKIDIPKNLLFNQEQIFSILFNEINIINNNKTYKHYIIPYEDNIYDLRVKIIFEKVELELKFLIDSKLYPYYPPKIEVISPNLKLSLLLSLLDLNILKLENWNYTITFEWLINNLYQVLYPIINDYIDDNNINNELENLLIRLSFLSKEKNIDKLNIDLKVNKININKLNNVNKYWKSGTGYGTGIGTESEWNVKKYILEKEVENNEFKLILESISNFINIDKILIITNSYLLQYILNSTLDITLLSIENNKIVISVIIKILDQLYDFKNYLSLEFITNIVNNLKNINNAINLLFTNNEESNINLLYQNIQNSYKKYNDLIQTNNNDLIKTNNNDLIKTKQDNYTEIMKELQFTTTEIYKDHLFCNEIKNKSSIRIISELSSIKNSLPLNYDSTIWMRIPEISMNIFTFMICGPKDTPYENGLFLFHGHFPLEYPNVEPKILIKTTGMGTVRFNPNLYANGKVCLSLLGTWSGHQNEKWNKTSSFLQVLVSIQSLILVEQPYFNEPGYERIIGSSQGDKLSFEYNEEIRYNNIKYGIIDQINNSPIDYKDVIDSHFKIKKEDILDTCKKWVDESIKFKIKMLEIYNILEETLNKIH